MLIKDIIEVFSNLLVVTSQEHGCIVKWRYFFNFIRKKSIFDQIILELNTILYIEKPKKEKKVKLKESKKTKKAEKEEKTEKYVFNANYQILDFFVIVFR